MNRILTLTIFLMAAASSLATKENVISEKEEIQLRESLGKPINRDPKVEASYISSFELSELPQVILEEKDTNKFPEYPDSDRWTELFIRIYLNQEGEVDKVEVLESRFSKIEEYVSNHLTKQRYKPGRKEDLPVKCYFEVPFYLNIDYYLRNQNQSSHTTPASAPR